MRAVGPWAGVIRQPSPLPRGLRACGLAALALLLSIVPQPTTAQTRTADWRFEDDAFVDLWFHGLATVGFKGFGPTPLYDAAYALTARADGRSEGAAPSRLARSASKLLASFEHDEAFEVLHFVPLYFQGATREQAMRALRQVAQFDRGVPKLDPSVRTGGSVVASLLPTANQRRVLSEFLDDLEEEWSAVVEPRRRARSAENGARLESLRDRWATTWAPALSEFLNHTGYGDGLVLVSPALGMEGRFLERDPASPSRALVVVGVPEGEGGIDAALSSLVRELCYPAVRRAFEPFEGRLPNRMDQSRASDLAATRCAELLLEARAPEHLAAYRSRFGLPSGGMGRGFLSASGHLPDAAAWEAELDRALRRELNLDLDEVRAGARPVGRN